MFTESIRTFVAVEIPDAVKQRVEELETRLKKSRADITWVKPRNMHLTLRFLGEIPAARMDAVRDGVREALASFQTFQVSLEHLGAFPNLDRPRVFWIGVKDGEACLKAMQSRIETALCAREFVREERPFSPHLTIGRVRSPRGLRALTHLIRQTAFEASAFPVDRVSIIKSELQPTGPVYTVLEQTALNGP